MLRAKIITAAILAPLVVFAMLNLSMLALAGLFVCVIAYTAWEWSALMNVKNVWVRILYVLFIITLLYCSFIIILSSPWFWLYGIIIAATVCWCVSAVLIALYPRLSKIWDKKILVGLLGIFVLVACWDSLMYLLGLGIVSVYLGPPTILYLLALIYFADIGAYFIGHCFGKHNTALAVGGGMLLAMVSICIPSYFLLKGHLLGPEQWVWWVLLNLLTLCFAVVGRLTISMLKQCRHFKNSGWLLPGYGGLLDVMGSLTSAAPIFALGCLLLIR